MWTFFSGSLTHCSPIIGMRTALRSLLGYVSVRSRYENPYWQFQFRILEKTRIHGPTIPIHIACMQYIPNLRSKLFLLAHELMQKEPESPISSYAVAIWYLFTKKYALSRRWIRYTSSLCFSFEREASNITLRSKTTLLDPRNAPAWIAFAHTFAFEGEHDQAVTAYSTCARLFRG